MRPLKKYVFLIAFLLAALYFYTQSGTEAADGPGPMTENPSGASPAPPPAETPADTGNPPEPTPSQEEEKRPLAFDYLPKAKMGYVDWVAAIKEGAIQPRESLDPHAVTMPAIDFQVIFKVTASGLPDVVFPHFPHTLWLDCRNCHPGIFLMQAGANPVTMAKILRGEFCGRCHGVVAFPIADCFRCHSRPK